MAWYKTGTVAVTNGSTTVTGSGTNWIAGANVGEGFQGPDGEIYEITAIGSATSLTLAAGYGGSTASGVTYAIVPTHALTASLASSVADLISDYQSVVDNAGAGKFGDGSAAAPAITFTLDQDTGFFRDTANEIAVAVGGTKIGEFNSTGLNMTTAINADGLTVDDDTATITIKSFLPKLILDDDSAVGAGSDKLIIQSASAQSAGDYEFVINNDQTSSTDQTAIKISGNGDISFYEDTGTTAKFFWDASAESLGIGTTSPNGGRKLHVFDSGDAILRVETTTASGDGRLELVGDSAGVSQIRFGDEVAVNVGLLTYTHSENSMAFNTNGSERMRIDDLGNLLVGTTNTSLFNNSTDETGFSYKPGGSITVSRVNGGCLFLNRQNSDGDIVDLRKNGSQVGAIGNNSASAGLEIYSPIGGGIGCYSTGVAPVNGNGVYVDNSKDLGSSTVRWDDVYATNGTIQTSDRNEKQDIEALSDAEQRVAVACKGLLRKFRWKDAVAEKGDDARIHFGIIAQDLQDAFTAEGLDAGDYAMFISSTWWETQTEVPAVEADEENDIEAKEAYTRTDTYETLEEAPEGATERTRLGVRYPELLAFIIAAI